MLTYMDDFLTINLMNKAVERWINEKCHLLKVETDELYNAREEPTENK